MFLKIYLSQVCYLTGGIYLDILKMNTQVINY